MKRGLLLPFLLVSLFSVAQNTPWSTTGNIGIGTTSPDWQLSIGAASGANSLITFRQANTTKAYVGLGMDGIFRNEAASGTNLELRTIGNNYLNFSTNLLERMRLTGDGRLGVGTSSPRTKMDLWGGDFSITGTNLNGTAILTTRSGLTFLGSNTYSNGLSINASGNVGIGLGTSIPEGRLDISAPGTNDGVLLRSGAGFLKFYAPTMTQGASNQITKLGDAALIYGSAEQTSGSNVAFGFVLAPWHNSKTGLRMDNEGNVGIGTNETTDINFKLFVETGIRTRKIKVDQSNWPDYVFTSGYNLPSLPDVENYIANNRHLPGVPSVEVINREGLDLGENQATLLKKIEELTLYAIQLEKANKALEEKVEKNSAESKSQFEELQSKLHQILATRIVGVTRPSR